MNLAENILNLLTKQILLFVCLFVLRWNMTQTYHVHHVNHSRAVALSTAINIFYRCCYSSFISWACLLVLFVTPMGHKSSSSLYLCCYLNNLTLSILPAPPSLITPYHVHRWSDENNHLTIIFVPVCVDVVLQLSLSTS